MARAERAEESRETIERSGNLFARGISRRRAARGSGRSNGRMAGRRTRARGNRLCELWQEFRFCPTGFPAAKHGQLRAYMSELGLTDERNRIGGDDGKVKDEFDDD